MKTVDISKRRKLYATGKAGSVYKAGQEVYIGELVGDALIANGTLSTTSPKKDEVLQSQNTKQKADIKKVFDKKNKESKEQK